MQAWKNFLKKKEQDLGKDAVQRWLRSLKIVDFDACNLYLEAQDSFQVLWFEEHIRPGLKIDFLNNNDRPIRVHLKVGNAESPDSRHTKKEDEREIASSLRFDRLDPHCTFASFIPTEGNRLAYRLLCELTGYYPKDQSFRSPELEHATFNPIYLWGPPGTGKSHLLMATAQALTNQGLLALYCRGETFTEHVVRAIRAGEMHTFRETYRNVDVLLIDDIQVFGRKSATQEELFHTFNTLHTGGKQIILSSSVSPQDLQLIEARLVSRFEWGIAVPFKKSTEEELREILAMKSATLQFTLQPKIADFLIETFSSSGKALVRALEALVLRSHLNRGPAILPAHEAGVVLAKKYLQDLIEEEKQSSLTVEKILQAVAGHYMVDVDDILGKSQKRECALPRKMAMFFCRNQLQIPYKRIGELFKRDHSTVMTSVRQVEKLLQEKQAEIYGAHKGIKKKLQIV